MQSLMDWVAVLAIALLLGCAHLLDTLQGGAA